MGFAGSVNQSAGSATSIFRQVLGLGPSRIRGSGDAVETARRRCDLPMLRLVNASSAPRRLGFAPRWAHRSRVIEAMLLLGLAAAAQRFVPMPWWSGLIGEAASVPSEWRGQRIERLPSRWATPTERKVVKAIESASRLVPWAPRCLAEATAGQVMLRQFGAPGVVVIGLQPAEAAPMQTWNAHAWLLGQHGALTGGRAASGFTATTVFQVAGGLSADAVELAPSQSAGAVSAETDPPSTDPPSMVSST